MIPPTTVSTIKQAIASVGSPMIIFPYHVATAKGTFWRYGSLRIGSFSVLRQMTEVWRIMMSCLDIEGC